ncbi:MAG: TaqI-like C-terminal specificity domain-containing protein [Segetibacter sp.]
MHRLPDISLYGETKDERVFNIALELCITWINRILFLKLLEGQLITYHQGNKEYRFLNPETIHDLDELFKLFHKVLAIDISERTEAVKKKYSRVPYLNSSLFEISELEDHTIKINSLDNDGQLELMNTTILKDSKRKADKLPSLDYLFKFLDAYDFASEGTEDVQEENKTIINASVLGKVFEKINGYKDGSIFTPAFITMYMCRQSIRLAVVEKFNEALSEKGTKLFDKFDDIKNYTSRLYKTNEILKANEVINSLHICDPAVGSGHFLVSALNEIISIKAELGILAGDKGNNIGNYEIEIVNDELIITDHKGNIVEYKLQNGKPISKEVQRLQKTLFHEKQIVIENCLFGVDINPKSVLICRLRLWIELLKNAYYKEPDFTELETLPNIDINIKSGNSLLSRFALDADLSKALKSIKYDVKAYRGFVNDYKNEKSRDVKRGLQKIIDNIKNDFRAEIFNNDPKVIRLNKISGELFNLFNQTKLFEEDAKQKKARKEKQQKLELDINKLSKEIEEIKSNAIYINSFEWRFEFPEVLNNNGEFEGFDLIIGNPPYFSLSKIKEQGNYFQNAGYQTYSKGADIYCLFYERGNQVLKSNGLLIYITSNSWLKAIYGEALKKYFIEKLQPLELLNIEDAQVFSEATVESNIMFLQKTNKMKPFMVCNMSKDYSIGSSLTDYFQNHSFQIDIKKNKNWIIGNEVMGSLKQKIKDRSKLLKDFDVTINFGIKTGYNEAFIIDEETKNKLVNENINNAKIIKPIIRGRDIKRYSYEFPKLWLIYIPKGFTIKKNLAKDNINYLAEPTPRYGDMKFDDAWEWFQENYHGVAKYLLAFKEKAEARQDKGDYWWEQRACAYLEDFDKTKIIWGEISDKAKFAFDDCGYFAEATCFLMTGKNLKYLLSILNSKVSEWYFNQISTTTGMGTNRWKKYKIELLPIKVISTIDQQPFISLVDKILEAKQSGKDSSEYERKIDEMVYKLYDITDHEQKLIEATANTQKHTYLQAHEA